MPAPSLENRPGSAIEDRWLSVDEIVEYLGVSRDTIYAWIADRGLPAHRVGRLWKFKKDAVDAWVQSGGADTARGAKRAARKRKGRGRRHDQA
jgi:excisionase family DNA binding protein